MNNNSIDIRIIAKDLASQTIKEVKNQVKGLDDNVGSVSKSSSVLTGAVIGLTSAVTTFGLSIISSGIENLVGWFSGAVDSAVEFEKTMVTLSIIAPKFGVSVDEAKKAASELGEELRIGVGPAAESLQNLLKAGLNLDQASDLLKRFTNEAITGKSSSITLAQAVQNLSFAYTTNNSALGNLSGINENFSDITERGRQSLVNQGLAVGDITEEMAKYQGMIELTNLTIGSAEAFTDTYIDKQAQLNFKFDEFQRNIGALLLPILSDVLDVFTQIFDEVSPKLQEYANTLIPEIGRVFREDIIPYIKEFVQYLGSPQFREDLQGTKQIFVEIRDTIASIVGAIRSITGDPTFRSLMGFSKGVADQIQANPKEGLMLGLPILRQLGILPKYADGTNYHSGGIAMVGEKGPELVNLPRGSQVTPNGSGMNNIFNFYGYDMEQVSSRINQQINLGY